jgi:hypothetical protein
VERLTHEPDTFASGECYEAAFRTLEAEGLDRAANKLKPTEWVLVHGIIDDGKGPFGHAWLEKGETVYDPIKRIYSVRHEYYRTNRVSLTIQYTFLLALKNIINMTTYGCWDQRIARAQHLPRPAGSGGEAGAQG